MATFWCKFLCGFNIHQNASAYFCNTILWWVNSFWTKKSIIKTKAKGPQRTLQNIKNVTQAMLQSPSCSALRHSTKLGISKRTAKLSFHEYLRFLSYKLAMVQELNENV